MKYLNVLQYLNTTSKSGISHFYVGMLFTVSEIHLKVSNVSTDNVQLNFN